MVARCIFFEKELNKTVIFFQCFTEICVFVGKCLMKINYRKGKVSLVTVLSIVIIDKMVVALFYSSVFSLKLN